MNSIYHRQFMFCNDSHTVFHGPLTPTFQTEVIYSISIRQFQSTSSNQIANVLTCCLAWLKVFAMPGGFSLSSCPSIYLSIYLSVYLFSWVSISLPPCWLRTPSSTVLLANPLLHTMCYVCDQFLSWPSTKLCKALAMSIFPLSVPKHTSWSS